MDLREIGWGSVDWIQLAQDKDRWRALVNTVMNLRVLHHGVSYTGFCLEGMRKATNNLSQNSRSPGRDLNPEPPE
jgi:hypothetical protein